VKSFFRPKPPEARPAPIDDLVFDRTLERRLEALAFASRKPLRGGQRAERASRNVGVGIEFAEHRAYAPGEDVRFVDWSVYQRSRRVVIRRFTELADLTIHLLVDTSASMGAGEIPKLAFARRMTAALAYVALARLDRVALWTVADGVVSSMAPTRGRHRMLRVVSFLRALEARGVTDLGAGAGGVAAAAKRRGVAVLISDLYDPRGIEPAIDRLRFAGIDTHVIHLLDPSEVDDPRLGDVRLIDAESELAIDFTVSPASLVKTRERWAARRERIERACRDRGIGYHPVDVRKPFEEAVLRTLRRGGLLG
jgi:uncharacterized protein (DUF58 family)